MVEERIEIGWIVAYLRANGWTDAQRFSPEALDFEKPIADAPAHWHGRERYHRIQLGGRMAFDAIIDAIGKIAGEKGYDIERVEDIIDEIVSYAGPLDRLAFQKE